LFDPFFGVFSNISTFDHYCEDAVAEAAENHNKAFRLNWFLLGRNFCQKQSNETYLLPNSVFRTEFETMKRKGM
jgi:hypothetical protein